MLAAMLKTFERATLIGTATNGTGAGTVGHKNKVWIDRRTSINVHVSNLLFGIHDGRLKGPTVPFAENEDKILLENRPTIPHIIYSPTLGEITGAENGWKPLISKALFPPKP